MNQTQTADTEIVNRFSLSFTSEPREVQENTPNSLHQVEKYMDLCFLYFGLICNRSLRSWKEAICCC